jgi:hypothetical protein
MHLDATCFQPVNAWPSGAPAVAACGERGAVTFTLESTTCPACLVRYDAARQAGAVRLEPWGRENEVVCSSEARLKER